MRNSWIKRIAILAFVIMITCAIVWIIVRIWLGTSLTSDEFPLTQYWETNLRGNIEQLTIVDDSLIIARTMTELYAIDLQSGNLLWIQNISWKYSYKPILAMKGLLFVTDATGLIAINQLDGKKQWQLPLAHPTVSEVVDVTQDLIAVNDPPYIAVYQAADGVQLWEENICRGAAQAYFFNNHIVVPCNGLTVLDAISGETVWEKESREGVDRIWESAFAEGVIYFSQDLEFITAYDVKNGQLLWKTRLVDEYDSYQAYQVIGNHLFVTIDDELCVLHRENGRNLWCTKDLVRPENPTFFDNFLYLFNGLQKGITAYDIRDGRQIGRLNFPTFIFITVENDKQLMVSSDEFLIFANGKRIFAYGK